MRPNEITKDVLLWRIKRALEKLNLPSTMPIDELAATFYELGLFPDLVGVVDKACAHQRELDAAVARRRGHAHTAQVIRGGR